MARVSQEFYCGECKHYFIVRLNMSLNQEVHIQCPNNACKHEHRRCIKNGLIFESGRYHTDAKEEVLPNPATLSKTPKTDKMKKAHEESSYNQRRDGVPLTFLGESWVNTIK